MSLYSLRMKSALLLTAASISLSSYAGPQLSSKCGINVKNPKNGTGVSFEENCKTAYVHPPATGTMSLESVLPTMNVQFCAAMEQTGKIAEKHMITLYRLAEKVEEVIVNAKPMDRRVAELREQLATKEAANQRAKSALNAADEELQAHEQEKRKAAIEYDDCLVANASSPEKCASQLEAKNSTEKSHANFRLGKHKQARRDLEQAEYEQDEVARKLAAQSKIYADAVQPLIDLSKSIADLNAQVNQIYASYAAIEGASGAFLFQTNWADLVTEYQNLNKNLKIGFQLMPIKQGSLWATLKAQGDRKLAPQIPAILSAEIPGYTSVSSTPEPAGEKVPENGKTTPSPANSGLMSATVQGLKGQIVLSLAGACGLFDSPRAKAKDVNFNMLTSLMVVNASYTYELAAHREYTATYNLSELITRFEEYVQKGGFFSTSTIHTVVESNTSDSWFSISFDSESSEFQYTPAEQDELKKTLKAELADQALKRIAMLNSGTPPALPPVGGQSGAGAISSALRYCPTWYCQAGSLIFGVLDSIFGSKSAVSDFKHANKASVTDKVRGVRIVDRTQTLTFALSNPMFPEGARP